jgi:hypothetical protein
MTTRDKHQTATSRISGLYNLAIPLVRHAIHNTAMPAPVRRARLLREIGTNPKDPGPISLDNGGFLLRNPRSSDRLNTQPIESTALLHSDEHEFPRRRTRRSLLFPMPRGRCHAIGLLEQRPRSPGSTSFGSPATADHVHAPLSHFPHQHALTSIVAKSKPYWLCRTCSAF